MILGKQDITPNREITDVTPKFNNKQKSMVFEVSFKLLEGHQYTDVVYLTEDELHQALMDYFKKIAFR